MGGAFNKSEGASLQPKVLSDGRVIPPTPAQQAVYMGNLDIYNFDASLDNSDDENLSDMEWLNFICVKVVFTLTKTK